MATAAKPEVMVALTSFVGGIGKETIYIHEGELFGADDPAVKKWPDLFAAAKVHRSTGTAPIEQATAAPGEKRGA